MLQRKAETICLLYARQCAKSTLYIVITFNPQNNPMRQKLHPFANEEMEIEREYVMPKMTVI